MTIKNRPYPFPATITQRFSAGILDIGMLLGLLIWAVLLYHWSFDLPFDRPRYKPPAPDDGWSRVLRSLFVWSVPLAYISLFTSSRLQATPGMMALHLKLMKKGQDERLGFFSALTRIVFAFLPMIAANFIVLTGIAMDRPILYIGTVNIFSAMLIMQCLWLLPILSHKENRALYDVIFGTKVVHYSNRPDGDPLVRKIFTFPIFLIALALLAGTFAYATLNLVDRPLHPQISSLEEDAPDDIRALYRLWRSSNSPVVAQKLNDPRCVTQRSRYPGYLASCRDESDIRNILAENRSLIDSYKSDFLQPAESDETTINPVYLSIGSVAVTDLVLADMLIRQEAAGDTSDQPFKDWLILARRWQNEIISPNFLLAKSYAFLHYNHVLLMLPEFLLVRPDYASRYAEELSRVTKTMPLENIPLSGVLAHEYALYNRMIERSHVEFFPFTQPNYTRNQFLPIMRMIEEQFGGDLRGENHDKTKEETEQALTQRTIWNKNLDKLYNPLGNRFAAISLPAWPVRMHVVTVFDHNNALKRMLQVYLLIRKYNITYADIPEFIETLPDDLRYPFRGQPLLWNDNVRALYYTVPDMEALRRLIFI